MSDSNWYIPPITVQLPDGATLVKPGKAIQRASAARTAKMTGVHRKTLAALAACGEIRKFQPSPFQTQYCPEDVEELIRKTAADPDYWSAVRTRAFLDGKNLRNSTAR